MKKKYQNTFFAFGLFILIIMLTQLNYDEVLSGLKHTGYWFFAVVAIWAVLYVFNTLTWYIIIKSQESFSSSYNKTSGQECLSNDNEKELADSKKQESKVPFWWLYKITISGFALNYATPVGLMGGEPYRIMELSPIIGPERASSSVILYVMTHIFSHFCFWMLAVLLYILTQPVSFYIGVLLLLTTIFCLTGIWFFIKGYKKGLAVRLMNLLKRCPGAKKWARRFIDEHESQLNTIDRQITFLHNQNPITFITAVLIELGVRIASSLEIYFILLVILPSANFIPCILILALTSLFANLLFFIPLQLGGREGGFIMSVNGLGMTASAGIFVALIVRVRELIWTAIGLLLIKIERKKTR